MLTTYSYGGFPAAPEESWTTAALVARLANGLSADNLAAEVLQAIARGAPAALMARRALSALGIEAGSGDPERDRLQAAASQAEVAATKAGLAFEVAAREYGERAQHPQPPGTIGRLAGEREAARDLRDAARRAAVEAKENVGRHQGPTLSDAWKPDSLAPEAILRALATETISQKRSEQLATLALREVGWDV